MSASKRSSRFIQERAGKLSTAQSSCQRKSPHRFAPRASQSGFSLPVIARESGDSCARSVAVSSWISDVPAPGALNDFLDRLEFRLPAELLFDFSRGCDEARRIAGTARLFEDCNRLASDFFAGGDDFADACPAAST